MCFSWGEGDKYENVKTTSDASTDVKLNVSNTLPKKHGLLRKISQKFQQFCLNNPSTFALGMIALTLIKLFVQIFDIITDALIGNFSRVFVFFNKIVDYNFLDREFTFMIVLLSWLFLGAGYANICRFRRFDCCPMLREVDITERTYQRKMHSRYIPF